MSVEAKPLVIVPQGAVELTGFSSEPGTLFASAVNQTEAEIELVRDDGERQVFKPHVFTLLPLKAGQTWRRQ